jgi:hypothetical protein
MIAGTKTQIVIAIIEKNTLKLKSSEITLIWQQTWD